MTRPFRPWDARQLNSRSNPATLLDLETRVLLGTSPRNLALTTTWPLPARGVVTLVTGWWPAGARQGFVQARWRLDPAASDLLWLAPSARGGGPALYTAGRLLADLCAWLGAHGTQRIHAAVATDDVATHQLLRQHGFAHVCADVVYRRPAGPPTTPVTPGLVVNATPALDLALAALTVRMPSDISAGQNASDWATYPLGGRSGRGTRRRVALGPRGEAVGGWVWSPGRHGHWLRVVASQDTPAEWLVAAALAEAGPVSRPVYASARDDEGAAHLALATAGFEPIARRERLVKHTAARVLAPDWRRAPTQRALDPVAGRSTSLTHAARPPGTRARPRSPS